MPDYFILTFAALILLPMGIMVLFIPMRREIRILLVSAFLCLEFLYALMWVSDWKSQKLFDQLTRQTFTEVTFQRGKQEAVIKDAAEISKFLRVLRTAPAVYAHHSSPVGKVVVIFAGRQERFLLGADSANEDEYWFELENLTHIKQFHSAELTLWLRQNTVPLMKPSKARPTSGRSQPGVAAARVQTTNKRVNSETSEGCA